MNIKYLILVFVLSAGITAVGVNYYNSKNMEKYKNETQKKVEKNKLELEACYKREISFCAGTNLPGGLRMTHATCNGKQELCICGDPMTLATPGDPTIPFGGM